MIFLTSDQSWTRFGTGAYTPDRGWEMFITGGQTGVTSPLRTDFVNDEVINGTFIIDFNNSVADSFDVQLLDDGSVVVDSDLDIQVGASGEFNYTVTVPAAFGTDGFLRITCNGFWTAPVMFLTGFSYRPTATSFRMANLMNGIDYINLRSELVRFNGLSEVLKYWSCYRYIRSADILMMRFGNRIAEDGIYSSGATREQVKATVYNQKNQALKFQTDADDFINTFIDSYQSFNSNVRIPKRASFELNKLPQGSRGHRHFFPTDDHQLNRR